MLEYVSEFLLVFLRLNHIPLCVQTTFCFIQSTLVLPSFLVTVNPALIRSHNQDLYTLLWAWYTSIHVSAFKSFGTYTHMELLYHMSNSAFNLRTCHIVFHSSWAILFFSPSNAQVFKFLYITKPTLFSFFKVLFFSLHPNGYEVVFHCDLFALSNDSDEGHVFLCLLTICTSPLEMCLFNKLRSLLRSFHSIFGHPFSTNFLSIYYILGIILCTIGQQWPRQSQQAEKYKT